jgi:hypothetical protein
MNQHPRPNVRLGWQTCAHCLAGWYGADNSPCPDCAAMAGTKPLLVRRWVLVVLVAAAVTAVAIFVASVAAWWLQ